jgi:hypothetical protein
MHYSGVKRRLTMRLIHAGLGQLATKLIYPDHPPAPWFTEGAPRDRSNRLLDVIATDPSGNVRVETLIYAKPTLPPHAFAWYEAK